MFCNYIVISSKTNEPSIVRVELGAKPMIVSLRFKDWELHSFMTRQLEDDELSDLLSTQNSVTFAPYGHAIYPESRKLFGYFYRQVYDVPGEYMLADHRDKQFAVDMFNDLGKFRTRFLSHDIYHYNS